MTVVEIALFLTLLGWIAFAVNAIRQTLAMNLPRYENTLFAGGFPAISLLVTARNEQDCIADTIIRLQAIEYAGELQFVVINDRSNDNTGTILDTIAATDKRIVPVHITSLPDGWLGKVHALQQGLQHATGDLILCTDADVLFRKESLTTIVTIVQKEALDHIALIPSSVSRSGFVQLTTAAFGSLFIQAIKVKTLNAGGDAFGGVGAFNLIRRELLERIGGFEPLKMEVIDDVGLGFLAKKYGGNSRLYSSNGLLSLEWYSSLGEMLRGFEKNLFAAFGHYRYSLMALYVFVLSAMILTPYIAAAISGNIYTVIAVLLVCHIIPGLSALLFRRTMPLLWWIPFCLPLGYIFMLIAMIRSAALFATRGGVMWRDSFYPAAKVRNGQVVRLKPW